MLTNTFGKEVQATLLPSHSKDIYLKKIHNSASTFGQPCFLSLLRHILTNDDLQSAMWKVHICAMCNLQYEMYNVQCTKCNLQCGRLGGVDY